MSGVGQQWWRYEFVFTTYLYNFRRSFLLIMFSDFNFTFYYLFQHLVTLNGKGLGPRVIDCTCHQRTGTLRERTAENWIVS